MIPWSWLGGHADGETDLLAVALREVKEEAGDLACAPGIGGDLFSGISYGGWACQEGKVCIQPSALNVTYLLEADCEEAVSIKADENSGVAWFSPEEALKEVYRAMVCRTCICEIDRKNEKRKMSVADLCYNIWK